MPFLGPANWRERCIKSVFAVTIRNDTSRGDMSLRCASMLIAPADIIERKTMGILKDLANAPKRKPSAKRAKQDRGIFGQFRDWHHKRMAERAAETEADRELVKSVDWGIDLESSDDASSK